ncbi:NACHT domain-containing protein [Saccharothrix xinjiangensis]|uniref:NACHT domain-containing protein n=1 Tax=Saccharothrix xinjiangensis TaxID=204798 RepID=A0ABV9YD31_9PSEU
MSRPALFTFAGALRVLGRYERPVFDRADVALGGAILAAGGDVLGLIDPKNEAMGSLRKALDGVSAKLTGLSGVNRQELVAAAHTVIAVVSVFEVYREHVGPRFDELGVTDREKFRALGVEPAGGREEVHQLPALAALRVPAPGATRGFRENLDHGLVHFFVRANELVVNFLAGLRVDVHAPPPTGEMHDRYVDHYLRLAAEVPEFQVWALIGEHSATRTEVRAVGAEVLGALSAQSVSMERLTRVLSLFTPGELPWDRAYRRKLENVAVAALAKPLLRTGSHTSPPRTAFPSVERGFVAPAYRVVVHDDACAPSSESWWNENTRVEQDIDAFFAAHLASPDSTALPLLVLGHPGAGKSLLMSVLAARMPALGYAVVTVQLRKVDAEDSVVRQVETALEDVLSERVDWGRLADECGRDSVPVVLLDGFDELVQASGVTRSNYLQQVAEFQEHQADLGRPVAVVVTSRPLVVDRARIPVGTPVLKLEPFDADRVERWLGAWNEANASTPGFRPLGRDELGRHEDLAGQPLILLMLAIHAADPENPRLDDRGLSKAKLYERLIDSFVRRQARDKDRVQPPHQEVERRVKRSRTQLSVAALAMFNRGRQHVTDVELDKDLSAIFRAPETPRRSTFDDPLTLADRTVEEFFFIHSAQLSRHGGHRRTYEFLHATFGEYLIAEVSLTLLGNVLAQERLRASDPFGGDRPLDDGLLFALISHQAFTKRKPILDFATGLFQALDDGARAGLLDVLDALVRSVHERAKRDEHPDYAPSPAHLVARVATYSANLVCLRVVLGGAPVPLSNFFSEDELALWRSTVRLWQSGLDEDGWRSLLETLTVVRGDQVRHVALRRGSDNDQYVDEAQLLDDPVLEGTARAGSQFVSQDFSLDADGQELLDRVVQWIAMTSGLSGERSSLPWDEKNLEHVLDRAAEGVRLTPKAQACLLFALSREAWRLPRHTVARALRVLDAWQEFPFEFVSTICSHPELLDEQEDLVDRVLSMIPGQSAYRVGLLVTTWLADRKEKGAKAGLHRLMERLEEKARERLFEDWNSAYVPTEIIEYLAGVDATTWSFDRQLFAVLGTVSDALLRKTEPRHFLALVERFTTDPHESSPDDEDVVRFIGRYLAEQGETPGAPDLPAALAALRDLVG